MNKIFAPQTNPNDDEVKVVEWKHKNNDFVKKGEHIASVESSKIVEEIYAESNGYLEIIHGVNSKINTGDVIGKINKKKNTKIEKKNTDNSQNLNLQITKKAQKIINENKIDLSFFSKGQIIKEEDVKIILENKNKQVTRDILYQLVILIKNKHPYHAAIFTTEKGFIDLTLLGNKFTEPNSYFIEDCTFEFYKIKILEKQKMINFLNKPTLLTEKIIKKEKSEKGWFRKAESADYILKFRNKRTADADDMNCIEWLIHGLEIGGMKIPQNILTASQLRNWSLKNLQSLNKKDNLDSLKKFYK